MDDKISLKMGVVKVTLPVLNCGAPNDVLGTTDSKVGIFCAHIDYVMS